MSSLVRDAQNAVAQFLQPDLSSIQNVSVIVTSAATTNAVSKDTDGKTKRLFMIISTTACWIRWGASPTAAKDNTSVYLPANTYFYLELVGGTDKVAFIRDSADGTAQVIPTL